MSTIAKTNVNGYVKNVRTGVVINTGSEYEQYKLQKAKTKHLIEQKQELNSTKRELASVRSELAEIRSFIEHLKSKND